MHNLNFNLVTFVAFVVSTAALGTAQDVEVKKIEFESADGLSITADLYWKFDNPNQPFIVLCHQAGWSRGEYQEIAPKLNASGFNCMAIDQRSGSEVNGTQNETANRAKVAKKSVGFVDAEPDILSAVRHARKKYAKGKLLLWGSSYSAALVIRVSAQNPDLVDGTLSFAPGEYFSRFGKPGDWIAQSAKKIKKPAFITSARKEVGKWKSIFEAMPESQRFSFIPTSVGNHGSRALWKQFEDSEDYWGATQKFLSQFTTD